MLFHRTAAEEEASQGGRAISLGGRKDSSVGVGVLEPSNCAVSGLMEAASLPVCPAAPRVLQCEQRGKSTGQESSLHPFHKHLLSTMGLPRSIPLHLCEVDTHSVP